jgi:hypothetical protein
MEVVVEAAVVECFPYVCLCRYPFNQSGLSEKTSKGAFDLNDVLVSKNQQIGDPAQAIFLIPNTLKREVVSGSL